MRDCFKNRQVVVSLVIFVAMILITEMYPNMNHLMPVAQNFSGTLIATILTRDRIYLFSDGRVINLVTNEVHNDWTKVHKLTRVVGMLTAGEYMPHITEDVVRNCEEKKLIHVDDVAEITRLVLEAYWKNWSDEIKEQLKTRRIFLFITGFDGKSKPHLYYLDNQSEPRFKLQERPLFETSLELELAAISTGSGSNENPTDLLIKYLKLQLPQKNVKSDLEKAFLTAFDKTKEDMAKTNRQIGGQTFSAKIDVAEGYKDLPTK